MILHGVKFSIFLLIFAWALHECSVNTLPVVVKCWDVVCLTHHICIVVWRLFQRRNVSECGPLKMSSLLFMKQNFYSCLLPSTRCSPRRSGGTSSDYEALRSLYAVYQTVCSIDNYCQSCPGSAVDYSSCLHPGTSDCVVSQADDACELRRRLSWVREMNSTMEDMVVSAARRWQDVMSLSCDNTTHVEMLSLEHFDKWVGVVSCDFSCRDVAAT